MEGLQRAARVRVAGVIHDRVTRKRGAERSKVSFTNDGLIDKQTSHNLLGDEGSSHVEDFWFVLCFLESCVKVCDGSCSPGTVEADGILLGVICADKGVVDLHHRCT